MSLGMDLRQIAHLLGGEVVGGQVLAPGPLHSPDDRSLSVKIDPEADGGFIVHSFAGDDFQVCRDHVREKLGLPGWKPNGSGHGRISAKAEPSEANGAPPADALDPLRLPDRSPPDPCTGFQPKFVPMVPDADEGLQAGAGEERRHMYRRPEDGAAVRIKIKFKKGGWADWYRVMDRSREPDVEGWQAGKPAGYREVPFNAVALADLTRAGERIY